MKTHFPRLLTVAATLGLGIVIGLACSQSPREGVGQADAAEETPACCEKNETKPVSCEKCAKKVQRFGSVIGLKRESVDRYVELHAAVWPTVQKQISGSNIQNYSIYMGELDDGNLYLFSYFEYTGDDFKADMARMAKDPETQRWWKETDPLQIPQKNRAEGDHWLAMKEVFHQD